MRRGILALVTVAMVLAACGKGERSINAGSPVGSGVGDVSSTQFVPPSPPSVVGVLTVPRRYDALDIELTPPLPTMRALKSADDAFRTCWTGAPCVAKESPEILLALYTNRSFGNQQADGSVVYPHQNILAYVLTWRNIPCLESRSSLASVPAQPRQCDNVVFVDANSGQPLLGIQGEPFSTGLGSAEVLGGADRTTKGP
mgnify:CR=1 FL=1